MKKIFGNFLTQPNKDFPVDCELFDTIQSNINLVEIFGNIAGDKAILKDCDLEQNNTRRKSGYVFLRTQSFPDGEIIYWEGGAISGGMYIKTENVAVSAQGYEYPQAYTCRSLAPGIGTENYNWSDFKTIKSIQQLEQELLEQAVEIQKIAPMPLGFPQIWAGDVAAGSIPENYMLCDGSRLTMVDFPELYRALGRIHTLPAIPEGYFCLPDLRSRFIVGYNSYDEDYDKVAKIGGEKKHVLAIDEIPAHIHDFKDYFRFDDNEQLEKVSDGKEEGAVKDGTLRNDGSTSTTFYYKNNKTAKTGSSESHENRPPYYTLAYVMRVK